MDFLSSFDPSALVMKVTLDIVGLTFPETNRQKHLKIGRNPKGNYIIWSNPSGFRCKLLVSGRDSRKLMIKPMRNWSNDRSPATAILKNNHQDPVRLSRSGAVRWPYWMDASFASSTDWAESLHQRDDYQHRQMKIGWFFWVWSDAYMWYIHKHW